MNFLSKKLNPAFIKNIIPIEERITSAALIIIVNAVTIEVDIPNDPKAKYWIASWDPNAAGIGTIEDKYVKPRIDKDGKNPVTLPKKNMSIHALNCITKALKKEIAMPL